MSIRRTDALYAGARGRVALEHVRSLGARWVIQPKLDGILGVVTTDRTGRLSAIVTRGGRVLRPGVDVAEGLAGISWAPDSVLVAEVELWTEAANRAAETRGYRMIHLFDAHRVSGRDVTREPYSLRRDALLRAESRLVNEGRDRPWLVDTQGDAHAPATGRYCRPMPRGWRRMPVVPQRSATAVEVAWRDWVELGEAGPAEGLVVVRTDAPLAARGAKRKCKAGQEIDATVVAIAGGVARLAWGGGSFVVSARGRWSELRPGAMVACRCDGFYEAGATPKHARIVRRRDDLVAAGAS